MKRTIRVAVSRPIHAVCALVLAGLLLAPRGAEAVSGGFIQNQGQMDPAVAYYAPGAATAAFFTSDALVLDLKESIGDQGAAVGPERRPGAAGAAGAAAVAADDSGPAGQIRGCAVYIRFAGANPHPVIEGRGELATRYNYFLGNDLAKWRSGVSAYSEVVYHDLWPGIDLVYREEAGNLAYEIISRPGADLGAVQFVYGGADQVVSGEDGSVVINTSFSSVVDLRSLLDRGHGRLVLTPEASGGSGAPSPLLDNPSALLWSTYLGGNAADWSRALAFDPSGNLVVVGITLSYNFPTTQGAYDPTYSGNYDGFVAKVSSDGSTLVWSTFLGGSALDACQSLAVDSWGNVFLSGQTASSDFPTTTGAFDTTWNGSNDSFVAELSSMGSEIVWSTYLGGTSSECSPAIALDPSGDAVVVVGATASSDFPVTPDAYDTSHNGMRDIYVTRLSRDGSTLRSSTFLGGGADDWIDYSGALRLDSSGDAVIGGYTYSSDFPTTSGAYDESLGGALDVFVAKVSSTGAALLWSTFLGGTDDDVAYGIALDPSENVVVAGQTNSSDFPTTSGAYDQTYNGNGDAFVAKLSSTGSTVLWATLLGGTGLDRAGSIASGPSGLVVVIGGTWSGMDFPTTMGAYDRSFNGLQDAFVAVVSATGSDLLESTFLGGSAEEPYYTNYVGGRLLLDPSGNAVVAACTNSPDFPTTPGAYDGSWNGDWDVFVAKLYLPSVAAGVPPGAAGSRPDGLIRAVPNPSSQATEIHYSLKQDTGVRLDVLDVAGRRVATLARGLQPPGDHSVSWDGRDERGEALDSGVYFIRLQIGGSTHYRRVTRVR